ncbi:MAG: membrane protein insertion efficiency factor YidD [Solirubrobacterales bacterium]
MRSPGARPHRPEVRAGRSADAARTAPDPTRRPDGSRSAISEGVSHETDVPPTLGARLAVAPIRGYRRFISPLLGPRCRFYPSCSAYAEDAVRQFGPLRGILLAAWRVLRCNPLTGGGLDPLSDRRFFRSVEPRAHSQHDPHHTP